MALVLSPVIWKPMQSHCPPIEKFSQHMAPEARFVAEMAVVKSKVHSVVNFEAVTTLPASIQSFISQVTPEAGFKRVFVLARVNLGAIVGATFA